MASKARKTVSVEMIRDRVNTALAAPGWAPSGLSEREAEMYRRGARSGLASALESVLHETGNYHGFGYLDGWPCDDETRRVYYS